jgi:peptidoglycan/LPS O-acetylase OafA/YrhL
VAARVLPALLGSTLAGQGMWLALGMALAVLSVGERHGAGPGRVLRALGRRPSLCWLVAGLGFAALMALQPAGGLFGLIALATSPQSIHVTALKLALQALVTALAVAPAIWGPLGRGLPRRILALAPVAWLGVVSYSFYLWHLTVAEWLATGHSDAFSARGLNLLPHLQGARSPVLFAVTLAATTALAAISYRWVELPFLRRKER